MSVLAEWDSFCVIVGSTAGALIGLQFVVLTLIAERPPIRVEEAGAAFATPTIVHFSALLLLFTGIHNAWDSVAYHVFVGTRERHRDRRREEGSGTGNP